MFLECQLCGSSSINSEEQQFAFILCFLSLKLNFQNHFTYQLGQQFSNSLVWRQNGVRQRARRPASVLAAPVYLILCLCLCVCVCMRVCMCVCVCVQILSRHSFAERLFVSNKLKNHQYSLSSKQPFKQLLSTCFMFKET